MNSGNGTTRGYTVQVRSLYAPKDLGGLLVGKEWTTVSYRRDHYGVPNHLFSALAVERGLMTYETANALMAWSAADAGFASGLEFRLVRHELKYEFTETITGYGAAVNFFEAERTEPFTAPDTA